MLVQYPRVLKASSRKKRKKKNNTFPGLDIDGGSDWVGMWCPAWQDGTRNETTAQCNGMCYFQAA